VTDGSRDADAPSFPDDGADAGPVDYPAVAMACPPPVATVCPELVPSFAATIVPILDASCNTCHAADVPDAPWPLHDLGDVQAWRDLIIPDLLDCSMPPPGGGVTLSEVDRQQILTWIVCGTPDN
jgi:hypothetical protein